jgi:hypothetical protein
VSVCNSPPNALHVGKKKKKKKKRVPHGQTGAQQAEEEGEGYE